LSSPPPTSPRSTPTASATVASAVTNYPILGVFGVLFAATNAKCAGQLLSVGLADLRGALHLGMDEASWLGTAFKAAMMFIGAFSVYLGGLFGTRRVLLTCGAVFTLVSVLLPFAGSLPIMLALLVLAGLTAGTFYPLTFSNVLRNLPIKYVLLGMAMYAMDVVITLNIAPSLEAWYMAHLSWRWIFWNSAVLTPVMMVLIYFGIPRQPLPKPKEGQPNLSWRGFFYVGLGFALLYIALEQGQRLNWMNSATIIALVVTGLFLLLVAALGHLRLRHRLVNLKFLMRRNTLLLGLTVVFFDFALLPTLFLLPTYLGSVQGYLPLQTGPVMLWAGLPQCIFGLLAMYLLRYIDARLILTAGFTLIAIACLMNAQLSSAWSGANFFPSQAVAAVGLALGFNALLGVIVLDVVNSGLLSRPIDSLTFGGFFQTVRLIGGQIGSAFMVHFLSVREQFHSNILGLGVQLGDTATRQRLFLLSAAMDPHSTGAKLAIGRASEILDKQVRQQAFTLAISDSFRLVAWSAASCLIVIACVSRVPKQFRQVIAAAKAD
jgi:MFS transporter, DHA2 family, multidrug resistance protein